MQDDPDGPIDFWPDFYRTPEEPIDTTPPPEAGRFIEEGAVRDLEDVFSNALFANAILVSKADPHSPLSILTDRFRREAVDAAALLATVDLFTEVGIAQARRLQNDVRRYIEMTRVMDDALIAEEKERLRNAAARKRQSAN